jgi:hypothetical protein
MRPILSALAEGEGPSSGGHPTTASAQNLAVLDNVVAGQILGIGLGRVDEVAQETAEAATIPDHGLG